MSQLPYLPRNRKIIYITSGNKFMQEATLGLAKSGCAKQATSAVIVKDGKILGRGTNAGIKVDICPRVERGYAPGVGYELCREICKQKEHAEIMAIRNALKQVKSLKGASIYLGGHWWICEPCWDAIIQARISKVFLRKDCENLYKIT